MRLPPPTMKALRTQRARGMELALDCHITNMGSDLQGCLLTGSARLRAGTNFKPAPRKPIADVVALDHWKGQPL